MRMIIAELAHRRDYASTLSSCDLKSSQGLRVMG